MKNLFTLTSVILIACSFSCKRDNASLSPNPVKESNDNKNLVIRADQYAVGTSPASRLSLMAATSPVTFSYDGKNVNVTVYSRNIGDAKDSPIFEYGDLLNRAIAYKNAHPQTVVKIKFAMYKIGMKSYIGFNPQESSYGYVKGSDFGGVNSEKLVYSIVKAALNQVYVDFVYQFDVAESVSDYINGLMETTCTTDPSKKVKDYLRMRKVSWGSESYQQMHAKYMTVSHYTGDTGDVFNTVLSTTGNVDDHDTNGIPVGKDWVQSGMMVNGHAELMASYNTYFDLVYNNYDNQSNFQAAVRSLHATHSLNYDDTHFSSYFTPIPASPAGNYVVGQADSAAVQGNAWDTSYNPVAKFVSQMATVPGDRYLKANMYHLKMDKFGSKFYQELQNIYLSPAAGLKHFRLMVKTNSYETTRPLSIFNNVGIIHYPKNTHCKDVTFAFSGISTYYTVTGSTNLKLDDYASKANSSMVVKEYTTDHPVYSAYKDIFNYQF